MRARGRPASDLCEARGEVERVERGRERSEEKTRTSFRHLGLDVVERVLVLADIVGHVSISIHREQIGATRDEE